MSPTREELESARDRLLPDVVAPGLRVLFSGINPGLVSAWTGHHFARPGNRFWPALHRSGFTTRLLRPDEQDELLALGLGITNVAPRATARADELSAGPRWSTAASCSARRCCPWRPGGSRWSASRRTAPPSAPPRPGSARRRRDRCHPGLGAAEPERAQRALHGRHVGRGVRAVAGGCWMRRSGVSSARPRASASSRSDIAIGMVTRTVTHAAVFAGAVVARDRGMREDPGPLVDRTESHLPWCGVDDRVVPPTQQPGWRGW